MIQTPTAIVTGKDVFQETLKLFFYFLILEKPFDPLQLTILFLAIFAGAYLVKKRGIAKLLGKALLIAGIVVIALRVLVVFYLAMQM